ncbi:hypothetical protein H6768_03030 [Candidatus Peribacteria bacterium]|nr:hypothetical protein [Candidatus Peribacteria bacterium]
MNMYTTARQWETASASGYTADGFKGFSKKLNTALKGHPELKKFFGKGYCDGCDSIVSDGLDEALVKYQQNNPPTTTTGELPYVSLVKKYLDSRVL